MPYDLNKDGPVNRFGECMEEHATLRGRIQKAISLVVIGIVLICAAFVSDAQAGTPLPAWSVDNITKRWSAGCFIPVTGGVVLTLSQRGLIQLPFGKAKEGDMSPRETAKRETLEETGLTVEVHEQVAILDAGPQLIEGDVVQHILYRCTTDMRPDFESMDTTEVAEVLILDPVTMLSPGGSEIKSPWRFQTDRNLLMFLLKNAI